MNPQNFFALYFHLSNPILIHSCIFSPNYRDGKSLTPVYHSVINPTDPVVTETLLHDHGLIGSQDLQGWQEVHQVIIIIIVIASTGIGVGAGQQGRQIVDGLISWTVLHSFSPPISNPAAKC